MSINFELDEKFYQNCVSSINLKVKINPYIDKKNTRYPDAQRQLKAFRDKLVALINEAEGE